MKIYFLKLHRQILFTKIDEEPYAGIYKRHDINVYNPYFVSILNFNPMQSSNPNDMNIVERVVAPCPPFFKKLRNIGLILGGVSAAILTGGVALPAVVISIAGYIATASAVAVTVSQCTVDAEKSFDVK